VARRLKAALAIASRRRAYALAAIRDVISRIVVRPGVVTVRPGVHQSPRLEIHGRLAALLRQPRRPMCDPGQGVW